MKIIETERLILRTWEEGDEAIYYQINQDPKVIEFLLGPLTHERVKAFSKSCNYEIEESGYGLFAAEIKETGEMIGFIGLTKVPFESHFTPAIEVGWRLGSNYWGNGYASEGARACLAFAFEELSMSEIVSFTASKNQRSYRVMERIGMKRDMEGDFYHPKLPITHPLAKHILCRISKEG